MTKRIPGSENPISKAVGIAYNEETIREYYAGMKTLHNKNRVVGFTRILSGDKFQRTKSNRNFRAWLSQNKVWVRLTTLSSSKHIKIGWLLRSHPTYTHFQTATVDLIQRIGENSLVELELSPHSLTHRGANNEIIRTHAWKVMTVDKDVSAH